MYFSKISGEVRSNNIRSVNASRECNIHSKELEEESPS